MKYLFVRILEKCNAHCCMCRFGGNHDGYVFPLHEWIALLDSALYQGVQCIRLTGGEPLIHPDILAMVTSAAERGLRVSVITNGHRLETLIEALVEAGLSQVIVSIDSPDPTEHDRFRGIKGLYKRARTGLKAAKVAGIHTRVSTVCGPSNFRGMPALQEKITQIGVEQWELSTLKLESKLVYTVDDREILNHITNEVYVRGPAMGMLRPMGKIWWGETEGERVAYLNKGIAPQPTSNCYVVERVRFLDPFARRMYPCSFLPHRNGVRNCSVPVHSFSKLPILSEEMLGIVNYLKVEGFRECLGCSSSGAGLKPNTLNFWEF